MPVSEVTNEDCMQMMARYPDKYFDLAIVDPPYGIGEDGRKTDSRRVSSKKWKYPKKGKYDGGKNWDDITVDNFYIDELIRVSKNQIIWGANHFIEVISKNSLCWIVWDKKDGKDNSDFADCELAWTSFDSSVRMFKKHWLGWGAINSGEIRIHPTQKPVALYSWLLTNYAKPGDKILDTHLGSGSSRIAAYKLGFDFWATELDKDYFEAQEKRFQKAINEPLFQTAPEPVQTKFF